MLRRLMVPVLLAVIAAGCHHPIGPDVDPGDVEIEFSVEVSPTDRSVIEVAGETASILIAGILTTSQGGYELRPALERLRRGVYRFTVQAESVGPGITIPIEHRYHAVLRPWPAGRYRLEVVVRDLDASWERRVFDDDVLVQ